MGHSHIRQHDCSFCRMDTIISLILYVIFFAIVAYGLYWVCTHFGLPQPVLWLCGALLLIVILLFAAHQLGLSSSLFDNPHNLPPIRR